MKCAENAKSKTTGNTHRTTTTHQHPACGPGCVCVVSLVVGLVGIHIYLFEVLCLHCFDDRLVPSRIHLCICLFVNLIDLLFARRLSPAWLYVRAAHKGGPAECCWRLVVVVG